MGYLANFIVYTLAMVGIIVVALLVFKNSTGVGRIKSSKHLNIIDSMSLGQRKTLYIISADKEKFLIASDVDRTCLISKLESSADNISVFHEPESGENKIQPTFQRTMEKLARSSFMDKSNIGIKTSSLNQKPVMRVLAERMKG